MRDLQWSSGTVLIPFMMRPGTPQRRCIRDLDHGEAPPPGGEIPRKPSVVKGPVVSFKAGFRRPGKIAQHRNWRFGLVDGSPAVATADVQGIGEPRRIGTVSAPRHGASP